MLKKLAVLMLLGLGVASVGRTLVAEDPLPLCLPCPGEK